MIATGLGGGNFGIERWRSREEEVEEKEERRVRREVTKSNGVRIFSRLSLGG